MSKLGEKIWGYWWKKNRSAWISLSFDEDIEKFAKLWEKEEHHQSKAEAFFLFQLASKLQRLKGSFAEVGVFKGNTAILICEQKGSKQFHLFDTFEGFPGTPLEIDEKEADPIAKVTYGNGGMKADFVDVKNKLENYDNVFFHKGVFPETTKVLEEKEFCFVHVDVDLYIPTKAALDFFYPRMVLGGCFVIHDYKIFKGVRKAVDDFFEERNETVFGLFGSQAFIQKTKAKEAKKCI